MSAVVEPGIQRERCVVRATHKTKGRRVWLAPETAAVRYLRYGRIVLDSVGENLEFETGTY